MPIARPACQEENRPDAAGRGPAGTPLEGERRLVTVLFADVSGFTALSEQRDPEEVCRLLNACFDTLVPIAERYGGTVDNFIGDELMVLFGAPAAHEDDPARALNAALEMMAAIPALNARHGTALEIHIAANTGPVVAGQIGSQGRRHYTVIGTAVNLAARLQEAAGAGQIVVGPDTYRHTAPLFDFVPTAPLSIQGRGDPLPCYRLLGLKAQPGSLRGLAGLSSPMVGRGPELEALRQLTTAAQAGRGGAVAILGEAGLGKSRLVAEWRAASAPAIATWAQGHCLSYGQSQAHHLLVDLLRSLIGIPPAATEAEARTALRALARDLGDAAREAYPYLAHLLAVPLEAPELGRLHALDPQSLQAHYLSSLRQVLTALARRGPLVLVGEDVHWADPSSVDILGRLLPLALEMPLLFCIVARPDSDAPGWKLITTARDLLRERAVELHLHTLDEADSRQLIANLLQVEAIPEPTRAMILQRAEGNPFFVEEVIRMLIERGAIAREAGHWVACADLAAAEIPANLQALLMARIDRLPPATRHVLRVASIIGRHFTVRVLQEVLRADP